MPPGAKRSYRRVTPRGSGVGFWGNLCRQGRVSVMGISGRFFFHDPGGVTCLLPFCALRNKCFHCTILCLAEQMFLLYHFVPGGTNGFIVTLCALRPKMLETCDPAGVRCGKWIWSILSCNWFWIRIYRILRIKDDVAVLRCVVNFNNLYIVWNFVDAIIAAAKRYVSWSSAGIYKLLRAASKIMSVTRKSSKSCKSWFKTSCHQHRLIVHVGANWIRPFLTITYFFIPFTSHPTGYPSI
jgi:hypothetical protein